MVAERGSVYLACGTYVVQHDSMNCHMGTSEMDKNSNVVIGTIVLVYTKVWRVSLSLGRRPTNRVPFLKRESGNDLTSASVRGAAPPLRLVKLLRGRYLGQLPPAESPDESPSSTLPPAMLDPNLG